MEIINKKYYDRLIIGNRRPKFNSWIMLIIGFQSVKKCTWAKFSVN